MKIGRTIQEIIDTKRMKANSATSKNPLRVFAWLPTYCWQTERYVWLEDVYVYYEYNYYGLCKYYREIPKEEK